MEKVWTIVGLLWAVLLAFVALMILDSVIRAKIDEIRRDHSQKKMIKKLEKGLSKAIEQQVENIINDNADTNAISEFRKQYEKEMEENDNE